MLHREFFVDRLPLYPLTDFRFLQLGGLLHHSPDFSIPFLFFGLFIKIKFESFASDTLRDFRSKLMVELGKRRHSERGNSNDD